MAAPADREQDATESSFTNDDGLRIATKYWTPEVPEPRALVFICHGLAEHCRVYEHIAKPLTEKGILVFSHDHVGHGKSEGARVDVANYDKYVADVVKHVTLMREKHSGRPVFVVGHSMGGAIALLTVLDHKDLFKGMALIAPLIAPAPQLASSVKKAMIRFMGGFVPQLHVGKLALAELCRDSQVVKDMENDPLRYHVGAKARWAAESLKAADQIQKRLGEITLPWICLHGGKDVIVNPADSKRLHQESPSSDKTLIEREECFHQVHNEPDGEGARCIQQIVSWIDVHI